MLTSRQVVERGKLIYRNEILPALEDSSRAGFVVIDVLTGEYEIGEDDLDATKKLLTRLPNAVTYGVRIGQEVAYRIGGFRKVTHQ